MKRAWHPDELAQCWTLSPDELELLGNKTEVTRLRFAVLLKAFQFDGRFPDRRGDVADSVVAHLASQLGVPAEAYFDGEWASPSGLKEPTRWLSRPTKTDSSRTRKGRRPKC